MKNHLSPLMTIVDFKIFSDIDGNNLSYGYLLSNPGLDFYDFYHGEDSLTGLVDLGLDPSRIIDTLIEWYPELESSLRSEGVLLNGQRIEP